MKTGRRRRSAEREDVGIGSVITARSAGKCGDRRVRAAIGGAGRRWNGPRDQRRSWVFFFRATGRG